LGAAWGGGGQTQVVSHPNVHNAWTGKGEIGESGAPGPRVAGRARRPSGAFGIPPPAAAASSSPLLPPPPPGGGGAVGAGGTPPPPPGGGRPRDSFTSSHPPPAYTNGGGVPRAVSLLPAMPLLSPGPHSRVMSPIDAPTLSLSPQNVVKGRVRGNCPVFGKSTGAKTRVHFPPPRLFGNRCHPPRLLISLRSVGHLMVLVTGVSLSRYFFRMLHKKYVFTNSVSRLPIFGF